MTQTFGNYQLIKKLATGGMAEVWLARQIGIEGFNRHVVVKRILPHLAEDPEFVQMFLNEAKIASRFNHPNIAQIYDLGETGGQYFIAMEFIHGEDLGRVMRRAWSTGQWVARHIALRVVADACQGLYYAHTRNDDRGQPLRVVHRDISPQNILMSFDGTVKIVDFGIAKASDQVSNTKSGAIKGKFAYMAPEQAAGKPLDARSDLFALGLVLYELVTGVRPLKRDSELATLQAALECKIDPPSAVAEVPHELDEIVMRALTKAPDDRYSDAREMQRAIEQFLLNSKELATSAEVSELMAALFADRLNEEARLGTPNPATESSTSNPIPASVTQPPPPPPPQQGRSRSMATPVRASPNMTIDDDAMGDDHNDDEVSLRGGYALPAGTVVPSRKYNNGSTGNAPRLSRPEMTRAGPEDDLDAQDDDQEVEEVAPRPVRRKTASVVGRAPEVEPEARRRPSGQFNAKRRTSTGGAMPEAPARAKSRPALPAQRPSGDGISKLVDVEGLRNRQRSRLKALLAVMLLVGALAVVFAFKDQLLHLLASGPEGIDGVPVRLQVNTNPPTMVTVVPPIGSSRQPLQIGRTPIEPQSGAFVGDTIRLENGDFGINYEELIEYGERNSVRRITKDFKPSAVKVTTKPAVKNSSVWRSGMQLGTTGVNIELYPGKHQLEIRAPGLKDPVPFEVNFSEGAKNFSWEVDVSPNLEKK